MKTVCTVGQALSRVLVNAAVCQMMMYSNVIVGVTIVRDLFVFSSFVFLPVSTNFLTLGKLDKEVIVTGREFQIFGPW